jgi:hypothetical protein
MSYTPMLDALRDLLGARVRLLREAYAPASLGARGEAVTDTEADWLLQGEFRWAGAEWNLPDVPENERLAALARQFDLDVLQTWALFACLAPELDPGLERLYAYAQDHPSAVAPTPALLISLFGLLPDSLRAFLPTGALRHWRLLRAEPAHAAQPLAQRPLVLDERVTGYLLGDDTPDERIAHLLHPVPEATPAPSQEPLIATIAALLRSPADQTDQTHQTKGITPINLIGPANAGLRALARAAAAAAGGIPLLALDLAQLAKEPAPAELARLVAREVRLQGAALLIEAEPGADAGLMGDLTGAAGPVIIASRDKLTGRPLFVPAVAKSEQALLWRDHLERQGAGPNPTDATPIPDGLVESLVEQFDLPPEAIAEVAGTREADLLWQLCRERGRKALDGMAQRIESRATWADLVLPPDIERHLREVVHQCRHRYAVYEHWGFGTRLSRGRGISALFAGPSGCGKTTAAEVLAGELNMDLYRIDLAGMISKYVGETEKNLRKVFDAAEQAGAILFFDEADALFGKRSEVKDAHDRYANIEIDYLLQRMEAYRGIAILATNLRDSLDVAFLRRLRFVVDFPFPDGEERLRLWERAFPAQAPTEGLDFRWLARLELAGGNISTIAVNAAFLAAADGSPVRMEHVVRSIRRELTKLEKPVRASDFGPYASLVTSC